MSEKDLCFITGNRDKNAWLKFFNAKEESVKNPDAKFLIFDEASEAVLILKNGETIEKMRFSEAKKRILNQ